MLIAMFIVGILWVTFAFTASTTDDLPTKLAFKVFPFLSGCFVAVYAAGQLGWVSLGV